MNAKEVALQILGRFAEVGGLITQITLHKLLYYSKGWSLVLEDAPIFPNAIEAWDLGPVVPSVYPKYEAFRGGPITVKTIPEVKQSVLLDSICQAYGSVGPFELSKLTHLEEPWKKNFPGKGIKGAVIPDSDLVFFFGGEAKKFEIHQSFLDEWIERTHQIVEVEGEYTRLGITETDIQTARKSFKIA